MVEIRRARVDEASALRERVRTAIEELSRRFPEDRIGISEQGLSNLETQFRLGAVHEDELTLVAVQGQAIVGFLSASVMRGRATPGVSGEIDWLWVDAAFTANGVERQVAEAAITWLRDRGARAIFKTEDARHPESEVWQSLGFKPDVIRFSLYE
jgi:GNAT superfamily N-acetyltransferase